MNQTLANLLNENLGGTGALMLYYEFKEGVAGTIGSGPFTGVYENASPSANMGAYPLQSIRSTGDTEATAWLDLTSNFINDASGISLAYSLLKVEPFTNGFLAPDDYESESTFLFSFTKTQKDDGILFGGLVRDQFDNNGTTGVYGRGFNIGVNSRNKLFFQGIDAEYGEYVLAANDIELANRNICSVSIAPYSVTFSHYNLAADSFDTQTIPSNVKIQNNTATEPLFIGGSPTYYKNGGGFSGYLDEFALFSGLLDPSSLKSVASGFVATGIQSSGASQPFVTITGYDVTLLYPTGITGYAKSITGYKQIPTTGEFLVSQTSASGITLKEGERFYTGFSLSNGDFYTEEVGFLIKDDLYASTGDSAHATLGLKNVSLTVESSSSTLVRGDNGTGFFPLYQISPVTGFLSEPTGSISTPLFYTGFITGSTSENLSFINDGRILSYQNDYLYYLKERL